MMNGRLLLWLAITGFTTCAVVPHTYSAELPVATDVEYQPLAAQVVRVNKALEFAGTPLNEDQQAALQQALDSADDAEAIAGIQVVLDPLCVVGVHINPESRVHAMAGPAARQLMEQGWRTFLVKVHNEAGVTAPLRCSSPNARLPYTRAGENSGADATTRQDARRRWLDVAMYNKQPLAERLSGLELEYRIIELYSRDAGRREAKLEFDVGQGTQDLGFRSEVNLLFDCEPSVEVTLEVLDHDGRPTTGCFTIRDQRGRVYPARSKRLEPDFFFHDQVYRHDGETVHLPAGRYTVSFSRGPEYITQERDIVVPPGKSHRERFRMRRWIDMMELGWCSGDHHVHAAGCAHYIAPSEGVDPQAMMRHILGEDLNVGCVLSWGPGWYHQKQFFDGSVHPLSTPRYVMRYDVEVSGFPSSHAGHLVLLRLTEDDYPGTTKIEDWPSWDLPVLQWAKQQGAVVGFAHSGWGLATESEELPNYEMPRFDGIGANEFIVDVTHGVCDFISSVNTPVQYELNIWYHTLNCGFTTRISGETDFPCIYGERIGLGRVYVQWPPGTPIDYDAWVHGLRDGRSYTSEGRTHLFDFAVNGLGVGQPGDQGRPSVLSLTSGDSITASVNVAALLEEEPREDIRRTPLHSKPYWHIERARIGNTRTVPVELIVNGVAVEQQEVVADGHIEQIEFDYRPERSCWVALRVLAAAHTNPVFVEVDGKPIRASKRSAEWCLQAVDRCWESKKVAIRESELAHAEAAYEHARDVYRRILAGSFDDQPEP